MKLQVLCPQEYEGLAMKAGPCGRCRTGWDKKLGKCVIDTGVEHLPIDPVVPTCPIQDRCQHQLQTKDGPCEVRRRGLVCESALVVGGLTLDEAMDHPLGFNANTVATPEDLAFVSDEDLDA